MKKFLLFLVICIGVITFNYSVNNSYVLADSSNASYVQKLRNENQELVKENNKLKKQSSQSSIIVPIISIIAPILVTFVSFFVINLFRGSEIFDFERALLDFKTRAQLSVTNTFIVAVTLVFVAICNVNFLTKHPYFFWIIEVIVLSICMIILYSWEKTPSKHALIFKINNYFRREF